MITVVDCWFAVQLTPLNVDTICHDAQSKTVCCTLSTTYLCLLQILLWVHLQMALTSLLWVHFSAADKLTNCALFYPRDAMLARVIVIATCLSVTRRYCVKTKKASGTISSPSGSPKTLVFWHQISSPNSKGVPPNGGLKQGSVGEIQRFFSFKRLYLENGIRYGQSYY